MVTILTGQDSVTANTMTPGLDVYCGYGGNSAFSNMQSITTAFPGKKYLVFDTHVSHVDCYDIEPGGGSAALASAFFSQWRQVNLNKPAFYASASQIGSVQSALTAAGITRDKYYLIIALWDGNPAIPPGFDGKQYANTPGYDSDSFYDYMWAPTPVPGSQTPVLSLTNPVTVDPVNGVNAVHQLQTLLNAWQPVITTYTPLRVDGVFGSLTGTAVKAFQTFSGLPVDGVVTASVWVALQQTPAPKPVPPPVPVGLSQTVTYAGVSATLSWQPVAGYENYHVQVQATSSNGVVIDVIVLGAAQYTVTLQPGMSYQWRVAAGSMTNAAWSQWVPLVTA